MKLEPGLTFIRAQDADEVVRAAASENCPLYEFSTEGLWGTKAFFDAVRSTLPLDPPIVGSRSWDALSDSLWEGIHAKNCGRVAVLWRDATAFSENSPDDFRIAVDVLAEVAETLSDEALTVGRPTEVCVYVGRHGE
ncbi:barstar family protein [Streptomyces sp. NPDC001514]